MKHAIKLIHVNLDNALLSHLLTWINFNIDVDKKFHQSKSVGWNY